MVLKYEGISGEFDLGIGQVARQIGTCLGGGDSVCNGAEEACLDLSVVLQEALGRVPKDPVGGSLHTSYYSIKKSASGELTVTACNSSAKPLLSVVR